MGFTIMRPFPMYEFIRTKWKAGQPVLLDGGIGTELVRRGVRWRKHGLLTDQAAISKLHGEYLAAGSHVVRTDTFQLNPRIYLNVFRNREHMGHIGAPGLADLTPKLLRTSIHLALSLLAYNLASLWQRLALPRRIENWLLTRLQQRLVKTAGRQKHTRYYWHFLTEGHLNQRRFRAMLGRIALLPTPTG
jgi:homocysteine S-methyltransferase